VINEDVMCNHVAWVMEKEKGKVFDRKSEGKVTT